MAQEIKFGSSVLQIEENGKFRIFTEKSKRENILAPNALNMEFRKDADGCSFMGGNLEYIRHNFDGKILTVYYKVKNRPVEIESTIETFENISVLRQTNKITNKGTDAVKVTGLSSACIDNIGGVRNLKWYDDDKISVHYCHTSWQKEGQWKHSDLNSLGITPGTVHMWEKCESTVSSIGSYSTNTYFPLVMIEDKEIGTIWFMEIEGANSWEIKFGSIGSIDDGTIYLKASAADEDNGGWNISLKPGETYITKPATFGCVDGDFNDAIKNLTFYRRKTSLISFENREIPVAFNDYMNCIWCSRNEAVMKRLIDAAADAGCEVFCIDDGWQKNLGGGNVRRGLGDWAVDNDVFKEIGLQGVLDYIKSKGMKPGIWFEFDSVNLSSENYNKENMLLTREGKIVNHGRAFYNFRNPEVVKYLTQRVDCLYNMGVRYIKNDYNAETGIGTDIGGNESYAEGVRRNSEAFYAFIDSLVAKYKDLTIENCGSGGMREDCGTLRHFFLQSTSDQEIYYNNPSVICGTMAFMQPEKAGIWAYPYPLPLSDSQKEIDASYFKGKEDGEETIFNMIDAMCGSLYLSGRIDYCDSFNRNLVKEAVATYKSYRHELKNAYPYLPLGNMLINKRGYLALGHVFEGEKEMILAVWKIGAGDNSVSIDMTEKLPDSAKVEMLYPKDDKKVSYSLNKGKLDVTFAGDVEFSARMFRIKM